MRYTESHGGRSFICRLEYDSDLLTSVKEFAKKMNIQAGVFYAIGAVKKATVSYYDQKRKKYHDHVIRRPMEILSCIGNIALLKGEIFAHAHITLSDRQGRLHGGHVKEGTVIFAMELYVQEQTGVHLVREYDEVTGLNLLDLPRKAG